MDPAHTGVTILASFMASMVECIEALTVVLAVGAIRGWCSALAGTVAALLVLLLLVVIFGQSLSEIPLPIVQIFVGTLLLMVGCVKQSYAQLVLSPCVMRRKASLKKQLL